MDAEARAWAEATRAPWLPRRVERPLARVASMVEAATRGRMRPAIGVGVGPLVAVAAWIGSWQLLLAIGGHGPLGVVATAVVAVAMWLVFATAIGWTLVMPAFLLAGSSLAGDDLLLDALTWPVTFLWAELGCGLGLGLCPN